MKPCIICHADDDIEVQYLYCEHPLYMHPACWQGWRSSPRNPQRLCPYLCPRANGV